MLGFNHVLTGSIIAVITPAPLVPVVALVSHFILDTFPHSGNSETRYPYTSSFKRLLALDAVLCFAALAFALWLFPDQWLMVLVGSFFSAAPDFLWLWRGKGPLWFRKFLHFANYIQWGERSYGWILDAIYALLLTIALYLLSV